MGSMRGVVTTLVLSAGLAGAAEPSELKQLLTGARPPPISATRARALIAGDIEGCDEGSNDEQIRCLMRRRLAEDPQAVKLALDLFEKTGHVVGVLPEEDFEGGYRGVIHLVPQLPVGPERRHLEFAAGALSDIDAFLVDTEQLAGGAVPYRWRALELRFFRSIKKRTPAAFAIDWTVSYNVNGTLNGSLPVVRGLLFHEIFHLNDDDWSMRELSADYDAIVKKCGTGIECLTRYVPEPLIVKGGTYYSFMPGNGVREYAADLALRYFKEQREVMQGRVVKKPFKCGAPENARAWAKLKDRYFGGVDRLPSCFAGAAGRP
jgi:hypothetical protein